MSRALRSLHAQAEEAANEAHARRVAYLKELPPLLAKLDELVPALSTRGITIYPDSLSLRTVRLNGGYTGRSHKVLRISSFLLCTTPGRTKMSVALQDLGFTPAVPVNAESVYPTAILRKAHLLVEIDLSKADVQALLPTVATLTEEVTA